ncbi:MAG: ribonuclease HII, partial [Paenisporosarcina sp.]
QLNLIKKRNSFTASLANDPRKGVQKLLNSWEIKLAKQQALFKQHQSKIEFDCSFKEFSQDLIAGIDEAGRGPLAGPVVTAAVIFDEIHTDLIGINDSKLLSRVKRNEYAQLIRKHAKSFSIHVQPPKRIDEINIYEATKESMVESINLLNVRPSVLLVDAMTLPLEISQHSIIKGDSKSLCIAAASILAKTTRDELMDEWHQLSPDYHFSKNAGYGTAEHLVALKRFGYTPIHRKSFEPIKSM